MLVWPWRRFFAQLLIGDTIHTFGRGRFLFRTTPHGVSSSEHPGREKAEVLSDVLGISPEMAAQVPADEAELADRAGRR